MLSRRDFFKVSAAGLAALYISTRTGSMWRVFAKLPGGTLDPMNVTKFQTPLLIPPAPVNITALGNQLLMALAERADMIIDFSKVPVGNYCL